MRQILKVVVVVASSPFMVIGMLVAFIHGSILAGGDYMAKIFDWMDK